MRMSAPAIFDETNAKSWQLASGFALILAVLAVSISPEFSLLNLGASLLAGVVSFLTYLNLTRRFPSGSLSIWVMICAGLWLSPMISIPYETKRIVFATAVIYVSLVFQGPLAVYFLVLLISFGLCLRDLVGGPQSFVLVDLLKSDSYLTLLAALAFGTSLIFARLSRTRSSDFLSGLKSAIAETEKTRERLVLMQDGVQVARERILGSTLTSGESLIGELPNERELEATEETSVSFDLLITELRQAFSEYQLKGRAEGRISGPIRFVFFAPVAGYDEKAVISVDVASVRTGIEACLTLALESLPEIGARKREGVIRLSIRYGLRVIEVAVEDNGRGLTSRNLQAETDLGALKELVVGWGGKFDRLARLGVGSRTSLELRILRERTRSFGLKDSRTSRLMVPRVLSSAGLQSEDVPRA
ncbi:hypothetical protein BH10BDE1_BH10BDE1_11420 [soil metagenome]